MAHKIVIAGGTGFLGRSLVDFFKQQGNIELVILTRRPGSTDGNISYVQWDATTLAKWTNVLEGSTAVINLVGKSVNCRYTKRNKREIIDSRVKATLAIGTAIQQAVKPPAVWINAGSAAIFGDGRDEIKTELSATGDGFSAEVCKKWEQAFNSIATPLTRKVFLRIGLVFQKNSGLLVPFVNLAKAGMGGKIGTGKQYISWIHEADFVQVVHETIINENLSGMIHCSSPEPVTNTNFMHALRSSLKIGFGLPNPSMLVKIGAIFIGTEAPLVLTGRRVVPAKLEEHNFVFRYPAIDEALSNLLDKK